MHLLAQRSGMTKLNILTEERAIPSLLAQLPFPIDVLSEEVELTKAFVIDIVANVRGLNGSKKHGVGGGREREVEGVLPQRIAELKI